ARGAAPTAAYSVALFRNPGVDHLRIETAAKWAFHVWRAPGTPGASSVLAVNRQTRGQLVHTLADIGDGRFVAWIVEHVGDQMPGQLGLGFLETAGGHGWRTQSHAAGDKWFFGIVGDGIFID